MNEADIYSVRMRATLSEDGGERHVSGAERLAPADGVEPAVIAMLRRALTRGQVDGVRISVDRLATECVDLASCLPLTLDAGPEAPAGPEGARIAAGIVLREAGVSPDVVRRGFDIITQGERMRGAALLDRSTGERLEPDCERGVRVSRFDYHPDDDLEIADALRHLGLGHFRTREALALATKVIWAGVTAELCWSDEAEYTAGYVSSLRHGYVRFANFKPANAVGGRIFFVDPDCMALDELLGRLERAPLWITGPVRVIAGGNAVERPPAV